MNVYHKIVRTKTSKEQINKLIRGLGIDYVILGESEGIGQITVEFICSDSNPAHPKTMKDIDNLLMKLEEVKELPSHRNEPTKEGGVDHLLQISVDKDSEIEGIPQGNSKEIERA